MSQNALPTPSHRGVDTSIQDTLARQEAAARIRRLQEELAEVTTACTNASNRQHPGRLFYLLRRKWKLMQELFEAENQLRLGS